MSHSASHSMFRGTAVVSSLTFISRILGFIREILVARLFGASLLADALFVAFRIPNLLRSLFAEGALTAAFVPVFTSELAKGKSEAREAMRSITSLLLVATVTVSILGIVFAEEIVSAIAPGFEGERFALCVLLTRILMPYIICVSIVSLLNGALNSVQIFGTSAFAQVVMNFVLILGAIVAAYFESRAATVVLAISALAGGILQVVAQMPALRRSGFSLIPSVKVFSSASKQVLHLMLPAILGAAIYQVSIFLSTQLASILETGSVSWLSYADRLVQLPIGVFSIALSSVLLPTLSNAKAQGNEDAFRENLISALRFTSFVIIPISACMVILAEPIVQILFERGNFNTIATKRVAQAVQYFAIGLWAVSCHSMLVRACNAQKDTKTPTLIGLLTLLSQLFFSLILMGTPSLERASSFQKIIMTLQNFIGQYLPLFDLRHAGLALSSTLSFFVSAGILGFIVHRRVESMAWGLFLTSTFKSLLSSAIICLIVLGISRLISSSFLFLSLSILIMFIFYPLLALALKSRELTEFYRHIKSLFPRHSKPQAPTNAGE